MSINVPIPSHSDSENIDPSSLFALPLASVDDEEQQGELKDKGKRKKHNWKEMENTDELKSCKYEQTNIYY